MTGYWLDCAGFGVWVEDEPAYEPEEDLLWPYDEQADGFETEMTWQ